MKLDWSGITAENVIEAIRIFDDSYDAFPPARNTFLEYNGKRYPAKHIRSLAYKVAFGIEAPKSEFSGGRETVSFFEKLGFSIKYSPQRISTAESKKSAETRKEKSMKPLLNTNLQPAKIAPKTKDEKNNMEPEAVKITSKYVIEQKNALQLVLNRYFDGDVVSEKTFSWLATPADSGEYPFLINALYEYRGRTGFDKANYKLRCDFVCESRKLIFEYDERQHFSLARKASLESYPDSIPLYFNKHKWIAACQRINAKDNHPANRDETRAYYDSLRDILCAQNGYRLVRIVHGAYDWENPEALKYIEELLSFEPTSRDKEKSVQNLKIGLYLQGHNDHKKQRFEKRLKEASKQNLDIFVFPETCYTPYYADFYRIKLANQDEFKNMVTRALQISSEIGSAVIIGAEDLDGLIYNIYANAFSSGGETSHQLYVKHTAASYSPLAFVDYEARIENYFKPILLKGLKIGMSICYDCNHSAFSRAWGKHSVDIIINSTGGNVVYKKWHRYNKVRAIENKCFSFCTMGYSSDRKINSYTFAFSPNGASMPGRPIYPIVSEEDKINNIFVYNTVDFDGDFEPDISLNQKATPNTKCGQWKIDPVHSEIRLLLDNSEKIAEGLYRYGVKQSNIIICCVDGMEILKPENILRLLYHSSLKNISNKRYLIINRWPSHDSALYDTILSDVLKVRTAENFCAVVYSSPEKTMCFQAGKNKNVQSVMLIDGEYLLDFGRMTGPEAIWKNKVGMKASWRKGYETLISNL